MMEAVSISETSVNFYQTTRRNIPEDSHFHIRRRENPKCTGPASFNNLLHFLKWFQLFVNGCQEAVVVYLSSSAVVLRDRV
jgi:transposase-like protein